MTEEELLRIAQCVVNKTNELIQYSSNLDANGQDITRSPTIFYHRSLQLVAAQARKKNDTYHLIEQVYDWHIDLKPDLPREEFKSIKIIQDGKEKSLGRYFYELSSKESRRGKFSKRNEYLRACEETLANAIKFNIGNCEEKAMLALLLLREYEAFADLPTVEEKIHVGLLQYNPKVIINNKPVDHSHSLIIINLLAGTDLSKPHTWNPSAVICDPWEKRCYSVAQAIASPEKYPIWQNINTYKDDLGIFPVEAYIGPRFNQGHAHSREWEKRAEKFKEKNSEKWWKSMRLFDVSRPQAILEKENKELKLKKKRFF